MNGGKCPVCGQDLELEDGMIPKHLPEPLKVQATPPGWTGKPQQVEICEGSGKLPKEAER